MAESRKALGLELLAFEAATGFVGGGDEWEAQNFLVAREEDVEEAFDARRVAVFEKEGVEGGELLVEFCGAVGGLVGHARMNHFGELTRVGVSED